MKITYPECQVEITAEELIQVIDHFTEKATYSKEPTYEPGGIVAPVDEAPAPKPYPNMLDNEAIIPRQSSGLQDLIKKRIEELDAQGKLPEIQIPTEETPSESPRAKSPGRKHVSTK